VIADEKYEVAKINYGKGFVSGHNSLKIASFAQEFNQTNRTTLSAFSVGMAKVSSGVFNSNSTVDFKIYKINENTGLPGALLKSVKMPMKSLKALTMNFIQLDQPLLISGKYFIGYDLNYSNTNDSVAVYHAMPRTGNDKNRAFCMVNGSWQPFYWVPEINLKTSLLINAYGCGTTFAQASSDTLPAGSKQFMVYYPTDSSYPALFLVNSGKEEFGRVIFYDLTGRKISETERMLTTEPMEISFNQLQSAIYLMAVETTSKREVMKVRIVQRR
jgi:hypothetical protein